MTDNNLNSSHQPKPLHTTESESSSSPPAKGKVNIRHYGTSSSLLGPSANQNYQSSMKMWPDETQDGYNIVDMLKAEGMELGVKVTESQDATTFWQAAIRWALLKKYGYLKQDNNNDTKSDRFQQQQHLFNLDLNVEAIANLWNEVCDLAAVASNNNNDENENENKDNDLLEFIRMGGLSNHRSMQWSVLDCGPACQFQLHAHPNLEVIYCIKGELHEIRLDGKPLTKSFEQEQQGIVIDSDGNQSNKNESNKKTTTATATTTTTKLQGPDLSHLQRSWKFYTLHQGEFLVNEVGSIHKSFSATNGNGCLLLVLWGGSHADITKDKEPNSVNVQQALESMDQRLSSSSCDCVNNGSSSLTLVGETFLPDSERSSTTNC